MIKKVIIKLRERKYQRELQKQNHNLDFSLITNNCIAGIIYHNLGIRFKTPTINLFIAGEDYLYFVKDLHYYLAQDLLEEKGLEKNYPVGRLAGDDTHKSILIHFLHYKSFDDAKKKWVERALRINWDNMLFIWEFYDDQYDTNLLQEFDNLPIKKMCIIHREMPEIKNKTIIESNNTPGRIFEYEGLTGKRYLDRFDYISFLNNVGE